MLRRIFVKTKRDKTRGKHTKHEQRAAIIISTSWRKQTRTNSRQKPAKTMKMNHLQIVYKHQISELSSGITGEKTQNQQWNTQKWAMVPINYADCLNKSKHEPERVRNSHKRSKTTTVHSVANTVSLNYRQELCERKNKKARKHTVNESWAQ